MGYKNSVHVIYDTDKVAECRGSQWVKILERTSLNISIRSCSLTGERVQNLISPLNGKFTLSRCCQTHFWVSFDKNLPRKQIENRIFVFFLIFMARDEKGAVVWMLP